MIRHLWSLLFGCPHSRVTFPQTRNERTYVACLDCGRELPYNWQEMRMDA